MLESLRDALRRRFDVTGTTNGFRALKLLSEQPYEVVLSDLRMPLLNGTRFLSLAREHAPGTVRLLLTGQSTVDDAVAAETRAASSFSPPTSRRSCLGNWRPLATHAGRCTSSSTSRRASPTPRSAPTSSRYGDCPSRSSRS